MDFNSAFADSAQSCKNTIDASAKFLQDTWEHPDCRLRQAGVVADGTVVGGLKATADRIANHPEDTARQAAIATTLMLGVGLLPVEVPAVAAGMAIAGTLLTCKYVFDLGQQLGADRQFQSALNNVWNKHDASTWHSSCAASEETLGKPTFDFALATMCGAGGYKLGAGLRALPPQSGLQLALASGRGETVGPLAQAGEGTFFAMSGRHGLEVREPSWMSQQLTTVFESLGELSGKTGDDLVQHKSRLLEINKQLTEFSQTNEPISVATAQRLRQAEVNFRDVVRPVREDLNYGREEFVNCLMTDGADEAYFAKQDMISGILHKRLRGYGWDGESKGMIDKESLFDKRDGMQAQGRVSNQVSKLLNDDNLDRNSHAVNELVKSRLTKTEAQARLEDWRGIPIQGNAAGDKVGGDYLFVNKDTGEYYPLDVTTRVENMDPRSVVESLTTNPNMRFVDKKVPKERTEWAIGSIEDKVWNQRIDYESVGDLEQQQLAKILGATLSTKSPLNILDLPLPSNNTFQHPTMTLYELSRFRDQLQSQGMTDWATAVNKAMESVLMDNKGRNSIPNSWHQIVFGASAIR